MRLSSMSFDGTPTSPVRQPLSPEDEFPAGKTDPADMFVWDPVIGPADSSGPSAPNPMSVIGPGTATPSLASRLNWRIPNRSD